MFEKYCNDKKYVFNAPLTEIFDFSAEGDWKSGNPSDQLSERIVNNPSVFPSTAKRFTVIAGNREIKKEYIFLIVERPLQ